MHFLYILLGWEGSVVDGWVLRDAISRRHGVKVPHGRYYLVDASYTNYKGLLAPFRRQMYHLNEWVQCYQPSTPKEFFNMKDALVELGEGLASNVIDDNESNIVFYNQVLLLKILEESKGNGFQNKMLRWLFIWSTCTMLEPIMQIRDSRLAI
ncbi:hypothetical protein J1N35_022153 [Gossypium stocksii]|uniref:DDE Tnp4 domain-containing protein n=1 Tax=Gossypium stocksii TaxID=47602 RepID=A0A9D3VHM5_9ROSI|nr:hypothetical protein J1N35_022153 [Gossypium stocksii]